MENDRKHTDRTQPCAEKCDGDIIIPSELIGNQFSSPKFKINLNCGCKSLDDDRAVHCKCAHKNTDEHLPFCEGGTMIPVMHPDVPQVSDTNCSDAEKKKAHDEWVLKEGLDQLRHIKPSLLNVKSFATLSLVFRDKAAANVSKIELSKMIANALQLTNPERTQVVKVATVVGVVAVQVLFTADRNSSKLSVADSADVLRRLSRDKEASRECAPHGQSCATTHSNTSVQQCCKIMGSIDAQRITYLEDANPEDAGRLMFKVAALVSKLHHDVEALKVSNVSTQVEQAATQLYEDADAAYKATLNRTEISEQFTAACNRFESHTNGLTNKVLVQNSSNLSVGLSRDQWERENMPQARITRLCVHTMQHLAETMHDGAPIPKVDAPVQAVPEARTPHAPKTNAEKLFKLI